MATLIQSLGEDHRNIARLLDALEHEIDLPSGPDFELLHDIADYFCDYPDRCHHPKEDAIFQQLLKKQPKEAGEIGDLAREHRDVAARVRRLRDNVNAVFRDAVMPRDTLIGAARSFINAERQHMKMEERIFFPLAEATLGEADWQSIEARLGTARDPLFGEAVENEFKVLRNRLLAWEKERTVDR